MEAVNQFFLDLYLKFPALFKTFDLNIGKIRIAPNYLQAGATVVLIFLLVISLARVRRLFLNWSFGGWSSWFVMGFLLALILEGFLIISGKTVMTALIGWERAPKPISNALEAGREELVDVLGEEAEVNERVISTEGVLQDYLTLEPDDAEAVKGEICGE